MTSKEIKSFHGEAGLALLASLLTLLASIITAQEITNFSIKLLIFAALICLTVSSLFEVSRYLNTTDFLKNESTYYLGFGFILTIAALISLMCDNELEATFAGGLFVILVLALIWYTAKKRDHQPEKKDV